MLVSCINLGISVVMAGFGIGIGLVCSDGRCGECGQAVAKVSLVTIGAGAMGEVLKFVFWRCRGDSGWPGPETGIGEVELDGVMGGGRVESNDPGKDWGVRWWCIRWLGYTWCVPTDGLLNPKFSFGKVSCSDPETGPTLGRLTTMSYWYPAVSTMGFR